ncbi:MAG: hypothetical protein ACERKN_10800 [Velocimicrobium sp.]
MEGCYEGTNIDMTLFINNKVPLKDGAKAFERLRTKEDGMLKIILEPSDLE